MNERLYLQSFIDLLSEKYGIEKKDVDTFVKEFFLLIEEALEQDRSVKIKGFGTFKLVDVESRESVKVNTGERFQIQGYTKVSFVPDGSLRDTINRPFSHFETVVLNENTVLEDTPVVDLEEDGELIEEEKTVVDEKEENTSAVADAPVAIEEQETIEEVATEENAPFTETITPASEEMEEKEIVEEKRVDPESVEPVAPKLTAEEIIARELAASKMTAEVPVKKKGKPKQIEVEKSPVPYLIAVIVAVLLLCGGALLFIYYPDLFDFTNRIETVKDLEKELQPTSEPMILQDTIVRKDTVAELTPPAKEQIPVDVSVSKKEQETIKEDGKTTKPDPAVYVIAGTKTTYTIKEGETLTKVSLHFYGTKTLWPYIVKHNPRVIKNPDNVPYGTTIKIPELVKK